MKTVLIIEDDKVIRENTAEILSLSGYEVLTTQDGKEGVKLAMEHKPDIVVCDIMMPALDGYGVIHLLQKNEETFNIPFIFLTAKEEREEQRKGMQMGADDYITKPFTEIELLTAIEVKLKKIEQAEKKNGALHEQSNRSTTIEPVDRALEDLIKNKKVQKFKKKEIIYTAGTLPNRMFFIQKGKIKAFKTNDDGKNLITDLYGDNDFFGYVPMLEEAPYKETTEALEDTEVAIIPRADFEQLISQNGNVARRFFKLLAQNVTAKEDQLLGMAYNSLRKKVANALLAVHQTYSKEENLAIYINRASLASLAGTTKESTVRVLTDFKDNGLIEITEQSGILIPDPTQLQDIL